MLLALIILSKLSLIPCKNFSNNIIIIFVINLNFDTLCRIANPYYRTKNAMSFIPIIVKTPCIYTNNTFVYNVDTLIRL